MSRGLETHNGNLVFPDPLIVENIDNILSQLQTLNGKVQVLKQFIDGTLIVNPRFFYKIYEGYGFSISKRFEGVADDASVEVYLENPDGSGKQVFIIAIEVTSLGQGYIDIYRDNTVDVEGTGITPINLNFESENISVTSIEYDGTYTAGNLVHGTLVPGGTKKAAVGSLAEIGESVIMPEDFNFLVKTTNKSGASTDMSIRILWWEEQC